MPKIKYCYDLIPIGSDGKFDYWCGLDLPIWNIRVYNNKVKDNATKMIRLMITEPTIIDLDEPNVWIPNNNELKQIDLFIEINWKSIIHSYNKELFCLDEDMIPTSLNKPDYTNLTNLGYKNTAYYIDTSDILDSDITVIKNTILHKEES